ncbi:uncharacterized protein EDB93DRAFT_1253850 [Suillus bovinus]|uniref:uncharacterized protein n=1 Tax=Suillus bovinus TaxID=48563 RepID=UPI001B870B09|nr:uncharacterized protein EDB93DRAFT_1253850 [Suillus bovinus]KAG2136554.1 hypothetical protein EDB93DRAFT_1253850 [Suillus bovinus]
MVSHSFMVMNSRRWVQAQPSRCPKVTLSKEARAAITAQRRNKSYQFRVALHNAWDELDETMKTIASSHHKSFCRNVFCWKKRHEDKENGATGKAVLQDLIRDENRDEYCNLTDDEKAQLLQEYREHKETKTTSIRISTKSKVNNVTQTLKAVENELKNLRMRTGAESILYTTHGSTDLPLHGITFATEGVHEFMGSVMNIDDQDLVSKMEGFAVQGMKEAITHDLKAWMHWAHYWQNIVQHYLVVIEGWPENIPFVNLSTVSSALPDLEMLLDKWETREIHWKHLDEDEYKKLHQERHEKHPASIHLLAPPELMSSTPPTVLSLFVPELTSSAPPTVLSPFVPELMSSTPPASSFFNGDMFGMDFLPANSPGAGTSVDMRSEFNFDGISGMLDFINFE